MIVFKFSHQQYEFVHIHRHSIQKHKVNFANDGITVTELRDGKMLVLKYSYQHNKLVRTKKIDFSTRQAEAAMVR